nr:Chain C, 10-mer from Tubulin beta-6 chain [synthetic construct]3BEW_F Chain F, 10-mer from Tubulin beta-6 chain [synthetic construct]
REVDEQLLSV